MRIGTGITRHERITWDLSIPADREDAFKSPQGIHPQENFIGWLDEREADIDQALAHFNLPAANRTVVYVKNAPREWRYGSDDKRDVHRNETVAHTEWYLQAYPYQSSFWFLGRILFFIKQCRSALSQSQMERAAGYALQLGTVDGWFKLKFSSEKRLREFEKHVEGADKGNRTKQLGAARWKAEARRIAATHPSIDLDNASGAARAILAVWPSAHTPKPSERSLRAYVPELAKRAVLPEVKI